jgi:hypothetical protein
MSNLNRYNSKQVNGFMSLETLRTYAPSIFTESAAGHVSSKYQHISTREVVEGLMGEGFMPVLATQSRSRIEEKKAFTKHMIRFRHVDAAETPQLGGLIPELVLVNSHDGLSSYRLMAGVYRLVCTNGLVAGETFKEVRVRHQGNVVHNVIEGTYEVMNETQRMIEDASTMGSIILKPEEKKIFAEAVHQLRFDGQAIEETGIKPEQFLRARRYQESDKNDLFTVFNVAQENTIRGGLTGYALDNDGRYRNRTTGERMKKVTTRAVNSIDQSNNLNRALWTLAEKMAQLKAA